MLNGLKHKVWWICGSLLLLTSVPLTAYAFQQQSKVVNVPVSFETELTVPELIIKYSDYHQIPSSLTLKIAKCESGFNPLAKNKGSTASGVFQFLDGTWKLTREQMGLDSSVVLKLDAEENIKTAIWKIANGGLNAWNASKGCWGNWNYETKSNISSK